MGTRNLFMLMAILLAGCCGHGSQAPRVSEGVRAHVVSPLVCASPLYDSSITHDTLLYRIRQLDAQLPWSVEGAPSTAEALIKTSIPPTPPPSMGGPDNQVTAADSEASTKLSSGDLPTRDDVAAAMKELIDAKLAANQPLDYNQIVNECEDRAHVGAAYLLYEHRTWNVGKIFVRGSLDAVDKHIGWGYHVAPYVVVRSMGDYPFDIVVVDPAFDNIASLEATDWLRQAKGKKGRIDNVVLRPAEAWQNEATQHERETPYCKEVEEAKGELEEFAFHYGEQTRLHVNLVVVRLDRQSHYVWFKRPNGSVTGYFVYRERALPSLEYSLKQGSAVDIQYERIQYTGGWDRFVDWAIGKTFLYIAKVCVAGTQDCAIETAMQ